MHDTDIRGAKCLWQCCLCDFILNTSFFFLDVVFAFVVAESERRKTTCKKTETIFSHRTVSWFHGEELSSHAYASFITIFETSLEKCKTHCYVQNDNFVFQDKTTGSFFGVLFHRMTKQTNRRLDKSCNISCEPNHLFCVIFWFCFFLFHLQVLFSSILSWFWNNLIS